MEAKDKYIIMQYQEWKVKYIILQYDEMKVETCFKYDKNLDKIVGRAIAS